MIVPQCRSGLAGEVLIGTDDIISVVAVGWVLTFLRILLTAWTFI